MIPDAAESDSWRRIVGRGAWIWARARVEFSEEGWTAFSGAPRADYNVIAVLSASGGARLEAELGELAALKVPGVVMLAGPGLATASVLADRGWVCVTATPLMARRACEPAADAPGAGGWPAGRRCAPVTATEWDAAQAIVAEAFGLEEAMGRWALPAPEAEGADHAYGLWDGDELVAVVATAHRDGRGTGWSMATRPSLQRRGYGGQLLEYASQGLFDRGSDSIAFLASPPGVPGYLAAGYRTVEYWQVWSRPRWIIGG